MDRRSKRGSDPFLLIKKTRGRKRGYANVCARGSNVCKTGRRDPLTTPISVGVALREGTRTKLGRAKIGEGGVACERRREEFTKVLGGEKLSLRKRTRSAKGEGGEIDVLPGHLIKDGRDWEERCSVSMAWLRDGAASDQKRCCCSLEGE